MSIQLENLNQVKTVSKPWGKEQWIQPGSDVFPFVLKQLTLLAGQRTSLQVHQFKSESILILGGHGLLLTVNEPFDCERFLQNGYTQEEIETILNKMEQYPLSAGSVIHTPPGSIHRMIAHTDLVYVEASTTELDDVIRLQDDKNRTHGKIDSEHK